MRVSRSPTSFCSLANHANTWLAANALSAGKANPAALPPKVRCAAYVRKSTEENLNTDFNSLDAQREACEAYVQSRKHDGWVMLPTDYSDGGYTGANVARAHHWKELIDSGKFACVSELATKIGFDFSYAARIYRLTYLAPDIIEAILDGREPDGLSMRVLCKPVPMEWGEQREWLGFPLQ